MVTAGLEDIPVHFLLQRRSWNRDWRMWLMVIQGREVRSQTYYIIGYDLRIFQNVAIQDLQHTSNHYMFLGCLCGVSPKEHSNCLGRRTRLPLRPPGRQTNTWEEKIFAELRRAVPKPDKRAARQNAWISEAMWRLVD